MINKIDRDKIGVERFEESDGNFITHLNNDKAILELTDKINEVVEAINKGNE